MKTSQTGSRIEPDSQENTLALIITCQDCQHQRAFRVNDSFTLTITRKSSGMRVDTWCENCGRRISVQLCWTRRHPRWVAERVVLKDAVTVEDKNGLLPQEGTKLI